MTLFQAQPYDPGLPAEKRSHPRIDCAGDRDWIGVVAVPLLAGRASGRPLLRCAPAQNFEPAYGIWMHDPDWKQHPDKYSQYPYNDFIKDWGPSGEWGIIKSHHVDGTKSPPASYGDHLSPQ